MATTADIIIEAIKTKTSIQFQYNKPDKVSGIRYGNPHAIFLLNKQDGTSSTKVHIVQTGGVSDTQNNIPDFRMFDFDYISDASVIPNSQPFIVDKRYNPISSMYVSIIAKI